MFGIRHSRTVGSKIHVAMYLNHLFSVRFIPQTIKTRSRLHLDIVFLRHSNDVCGTFSAKKKNKATSVLLKLEIILISPVVGCPLINV